MYNYYLQYQNMNITLMSPQKQFHSKVMLASAYLPLIFERNEKVKWRILALKYKTYRSGNKTQNMNDIKSSKRCRKTKSTGSVQKRPGRF